MRPLSMNVSKVFLLQFLVPLTLLGAVFRLGGFTGNIRFEGPLVGNGFYYLL